MSAAAQPTSRKLSVAMIVRDAATRLPATLESVGRIADQIVVCDTGSADDTRQIASRHGATVIQRHWDDDFSAARNATLAEANGDWVLWLDAGERISVEDASALRAFVEIEADPGKAYLMQVTLPPVEQGGTVEQAGRIRLVPRRDGVRFEGRVREQLRPSLAEAGIAVEGLSWTIHRPAADHDPQVKADKARRDARLAELEIRSGEPTPRALNALGDALGNLGHLDQARRVLRQAISLAEHGSTEMMEAYYALLTTYDGDPARGEQQMAVCLEAIEVFPFDAQLLCAMGSYLQAQGRIDLATRAYQTAYQYGQVNPQTWHLRDVGEVAAVCLSLTHQLQQNDEEARSVLEEAITRHGTSERLRRQLIDLHISAGRRKEALEEVDRLVGDMPHREALRTAVRGACLAAAGSWVSALAYLKTAYAAGCRDTICLRWYSVTMLSTGDLERAEPILVEWQTIDPHNAEVAKYLEALAAIRAGQHTNQTAPQAGDATRQIRMDTAAAGATGNFHVPQPGGVPPSSQKT